MTSLTMWVLASDKALFAAQTITPMWRTKREAQQWREANMMWDAYDRWKPKKVKVSDAK